MTLSKKVTKKMNDYGIEIYKNYTIKDEPEHIFYLEDMILFVNTKENSIGVSIQATTKPEKAATLALILKEIDCDEIHIMEPFIFDEKKQFISGEKAYELINSEKHSKIVESYNRERLYSEILENANCHEC